jgi:cell division protein FtsL
MTEWSVVVVIIALIGLIASVAKPIITLNTSIVKLTERVSVTTKALDDLTDHNIEAHKRMWNRIDEHDDRIKDHGARIEKIESSMGRSC